MNATVNMNDTSFGTCTFLNMTGDISITWNEHNREQILELVRKKMKEGYVFFTTKKILFDRFKRKVKITEKSLEQTEEIIITDAQFEKMISDMDDKDIANLVRNDQAEIVKHKGKTSLAAMKKLSKAEDVLDKNSVAIRPIVGG